MNDLLGGICEMLNGSPELAYRIPGRFWAMKAPNDQTRPYGVVAIDSAATVGRDSESYFEDRIVSIAIYDDDYDNARAVADWIESRLDNDNPDAFMPEWGIEMSPIQPFSPEIEQDSQYKDVIVLRGAVIVTSARRRWIS